MAAGSGATKLTGEVDKVKVSFSLQGNVVRNLVTDLRDPAKIGWVVGTAVINHIVGPGKAPDKPKAARTFLGSPELIFEEPQLSLAAAGASMAGRIMAGRKVYLQDWWLFHGYKPNCPCCNQPLSFDTMAQTARLCRGVGFGDKDVLLLPRRM
jgi:hypothetical protein